AHGSSPSPSFRAANVTRRPGYTTDRSAEALLWPFASIGPVGYPRTSMPISCVDGPRLARDHLACSAEVACSHVSGLLVQSGWTDGRDGVGEPRPHHWSGIDVPMNRQASLGCVGSTDCAITRHYSLASSSAGRGGLSRHSPGLVFLLAQHHRPCDARRLVRQRDGYDQRRSPLAQSGHPRIGIGRLRGVEISAGAVDQKPAQIWVAALGYPAQAMFAAGGILPWHQT